MTQQLILEDNLFVIHNTFIVFEVLRIEVVCCFYTFCA